MSKGKEALHQIGILNIPTKLSIPADPKSTQNEPGMCKGVIGPGNKEESYTIDFVDPSNS